MAKIVRKTPVPKAETVSEQTPSAKLPKVNLSNIFDVLKKINTNQLLVLLLILAAFLIGVLFTKVKYLEKNSQAPSTAAPIGQQQVPQQQTPPAGTKVEVGKGNLPALGSKNAKVVLVDFSDFECPFCKKYFDETFEQLKKDYVDTGKVIYYYRHFPLDFHSAAKPAAIASECANEQGKFWEYHDLIFKEQDKIAQKTPDEIKQALKGFAVSLGLNTSNFNNCLDLEKYKANVEKDQKEGQTAGVNGTPTFFVNGLSVVGAQPYSVFKTIIDQELTK